MKQLNKLFCVATIVCFSACGSTKRPELRWGGGDPSDATLEFEFDRGQNGSDLLLTLFKKVASEGNLVISEVAIHFIWDTTRLIECTSYVQPIQDSSQGALQETSEAQSWIALRMESREVSEEDYICKPGIEQVLVPTNTAAQSSRRGMSRAEAKATRPDTFVEPQLVVRSECQLKLVKRTVVRHLYQFYEQWVPPNWTFIATQVKSAPLHMGPTTCAPIDNPRGRRLTHRLTARVHNADTQ